MNFNYDRFYPFDVRDRDAMNDIWEDFETATDPIDPQNFAEEGIDRHAASVRAAERMRTIVDVTRIALAPSASWITFAMGTSFRTSSFGQVSSLDALRLTTTVYFESIAAGGAAVYGVPPTELVEMQHQQRASGVTSFIAATHAKFRAGPGSPSPLALHGTISIESWLLGGFSNLEWVELAYKLSGATNAYPSKALLTVDKFRAVLVP